MKVKEFPTFDRLTNYMKSPDFLITIGGEKTINEKIHDLKKYRHKLRVEWNIPDRNLDWKEYSEKINLLEKNPETWKIAQEFWNIDWILDELANIASSINQINTCLEEKVKLEKENGLNIT